MTETLATAAIRAAQAPARVQCTSDSCDSTGGCVNGKLVDGALCSDAGCSGGSYQAAAICTAGKCGATPAPKSCDDGNVCTTDFCDDVKGCKSVVNTAGCSDSNACTKSDSCSGGACSGVKIVCDDGNSCTDDSCDSAKGCEYTPNVVGCNDGDACTTADKCNSGSCKGGAPLVCDDGKVCTDDACDKNKGCTFTNNTVNCDDSNACTTSDKCLTGVCVGGAAPNCDDSNPCTSDACDKIQGCLHSNNSLGCDDGDACTTSDLCSGGVCKGGVAPNCDDANPCTQDSCDKVKSTLMISHAVWGKPRETRGGQPTHGTVGDIKRASKARTWP
jgi:hypothetical protein